MRAHGSGEACYRDERPFGETCEPCKAAVRERVARWREARATVDPSRYDGLKERLKGGRGTGTASG